MMETGPVVSTLRLVISMSRLYISVSVLLALVAAAWFWIQPILLVHGRGRVLESLGNTDCTTVPALAACESPYITPHFRFFTL